jgi:hypothetical protein
MKKVKIIVIFLSVILASCEKENLNIDKQFENQKLKKSAIPYNKLANKSKKAKRDSGGSLEKCVETPDDCAVFVTMPTVLATNGIFFNGNGDYINGSFSNYYSTAQNYFTEEEIENVVNEVYTVSHEVSDHGTFIVFKNNDENDAAVYQYGL